MAFLLRQVPSATATLCTLFTIVKLPTYFPLVAKFSCSFSCNREARMGVNRQRAFQLKTDPLTGTSEWVVMEQDDDDDVSTTHLMAYTSYLDMLNDTYRNRAYHQAIRKAIRGPCHVLDIGAGTGLLSMMSLRAMYEAIHQPASRPSEGLVTACESYLPMGKLARKVLRANGMGERIRFIHKRSDELQLGIDLPSRADVLVSEILDSELLGEGFIPTLQHAYDHLLKPSAQVVPYKATFYGQLVQSDLLWKLHDLHGNETLALDGLFLAPVGFAKALSSKNLQYAMHCDAFLEEVKLLSEPFKVFDFDFWRRPDDYRHVQFQTKIITEGKAQAVVSWWVLQLDEEGTIFYSTAPRWIKSLQRTEEIPTDFSGALHWCDHWKQCVWFLPGSGLRISTNDEIIIQAVHNAVNIQYDVKIKNDRANQQCLSNISCGDFHLFVKPERIGVLGDKNWRSTVLAAGRRALKGRSSPLCVVADDSVALTIIAASFSFSSHIISMLPGFRVNGLRYLQRVAEANGFSVDRVQVLGKRATQLTVDDVGGKKVDLLLAEPFYLANEEMLPWQNLRFWNERTVLGPLLSETATIVPFRGKLCGRAMRLPDLWQSRCSLKSVEGFDHSVVNDIMGACGDLPEPLEGPLLPYAICQCGQVEELSEEFTLMEFNFSEEIKPVTGKVMVPFSKSGLCHGFVLWMDWVLDSEGSLVVSTRPEQTYWKQGVKLLSCPIQVRDHHHVLQMENITMPDDSLKCFSSVHLKGSFDPSNGQIDIKLEFADS